MNKKERKQFARVILIRMMVRQGFKSRQIQTELRQNKIGMRRKTLLAEIRFQKSRMVKERKQLRQQTIVPTMQQHPIYRVSHIIPDLPVHSTPQKPHYLGFRITAFSFDKSLLYARERQLKATLLRLTNKYVGYDVRDWENYDFVIKTESPRVITTPYAKQLNGHWIFRIEENGSEIHTESGLI